MYFDTKSYLKSIRNHTVKHALSFFDEEKTQNIFIGFFIKLYYILFGEK